jgi:HEAT repeat protein
VKSSVSKVIVTAGLAILICCVSTELVVCQVALKKKIDSLFMIASSAELIVRDQVEPAKDSIAALGVDAVPLLVDKLTTKSNRERWTVIQILKKIGSPAVPFLVRSLKNPDGLVVQRVCWALGDIGDSAAVDPLIETSGHSRWKVREEALGALGDIGSRDASEAVISAFTDTVGEVRKAAVVAAGKIRLDEVVRQLVHMLGDDFYGARLPAAEALLLLDTPAVVTAVSDSMFSRSRTVGDLGCWVLGEIASDAAIEVLINQTRSPEASRRAHAAVALVRADPLDNCGFRKGIIERESDRLVLLKINSAVYSARNVAGQSER